VFPSPQEVAQNSLATRMMSSQRRKFSAIYGDCEHRTLLVRERPNQRARDARRWQVLSSVEPADRSRAKTRVCALFAGPASGRIFASQKSAKFFERRSNADDELDAVAVALNAPRRLSITGRAERDEARDRSASAGLESQK
jgi:hypothetical protein